MTLDERIRELCAQLFRAENPDVIQAVAAQLEVAIHEYVRSATSDSPFSAAASAEASA